MTFAEGSCFYGTKTITYTLGGATQYAYVVYYGGCGQNSVDIWFTRTNSQWNDLTVSSTSNLVSNNGSTKRFNLETNGIDRVGFRVPANQVNGFTFAGLEVSYD